MRFLFISSEILSVICFVLWVTGLQSPWKMRENHSRQEAVLVPVKKGSCACSVRASVVFKKKLLIRH